MGLDPSSPVVSSINPSDALDAIIRDNYGSSFYDLIVVCYSYNGFDYVYSFYTERYYTRLQFRAFEDLQTVLEADAYYMKHTALLLDSVLTNIDSNLVGFFTSS